jgi:polar amino acid transport system ATP-binding protein
MQFARSVADEIVFMNEGRVWERGTPDRVFTAPTTPELRQFVASTL